MAPRLGAEYDIEIEMISKPKAEYNSPEYVETDLPCAPAVMVGEEVVAEGSDVSEEIVVKAIRTQLGMEPLVPEKKGILGRLFKT